MKKDPEKNLWSTVLLRAFRDLEYRKYNTDAAQTQWDNIRQDAINWFKNPKLGLYNICYALGRDVKRAQEKAKELYKIKGVL